MNNKDIYVTLSYELSNPYRLHLKFQVKDKRHSRRIEPLEFKLSNLMGGKLPPISAWTRRRTTMKPDFTSRSAKEN